MAIINIEYDNNFKAKQKYGASIVQYSKNVDTIRIKFDFEFKSSTPAVFLYAERNDRRVNEVFSTQVLCNVSTGQYEYVLGSSDGDEKSSWFSAVPGPLKVSLRIVDGEAQYSTDIYSIFVMMSNNSSTEEVTFGVDQFNNLLNFIQNAADLKLNKESYDFKNLGRFASEREFASACETDYYSSAIESKNYAYKGYIVDSANNQYTAFGLVGHRNGAGQSFDSMVITQKGIICYQQGYEVATQMPKVEVSDLKVNMTTSVPYPSSNESATNKYYVDSNHYKKSEIDSSLQTIETNLNYNIQGALDSSKSYTDLKHSELKALLDTILKDAPTAYDTLKEIADYIASDKSGASEMLSKINNNTSEINVIKQGLPETLDIILRSEVSEGTIEEVKEMEINGMKFKVGSATSSDSALKLKLVASGTLELNNDEETYKKIYDFENSKLYAITLDSNSALLIGYCNDEIFQTQFAPEYANDNIIYIRQEVNNDYTSIHKEEGSVATEYSGIQYEVYELVAPVGSGGGGSRQVLTWDDIKNQVDFSLRDEVDGIIDMEGIDLSNKELIIDLVEDTYDSMPIWAYVRKYIIGNDIINTQDSYSMSVRINNQWDNFKIKIKSREDYYEDYFYGYGMAIGVEVDTKLISCTNDLRSTGTCYYGEINYITYDVVGENVLEVSGYKENNYIRVDYIYEFEV